MFIPKMLNMKLNGLDVDGLHCLKEEMAEDPNKGISRWGVATKWTGGMSSDSSVSSYEIGGVKVDKNFKIKIDEPRELGGENAEPNPVEYLLAGFNSCLVVGYTMHASMMGIEIESLEIACSGEIDLRHLMGLACKRVRPGLYDIGYTVYIKGDGTDVEFIKLHEQVKSTSPLRNLLAHSISIDQIVVR